MIQNVGAVLTRSISVKDSKEIVSDSEAVKESSSSKVKVDTANMSLLARQLSESALRSSKREQELSRDELAAYAKKQINDFALDGYTFGKSRHDREQPDTDDPEHLDRSRQATDYVNQTINGSRYAKNPFSGLSRDQLALIAYDDRGGYTINERRAAWSESERIKSEWEKGAVTRAQLESALTGRIPVFLTEVLNFHRGLPKIEQVQECYPGNYEAELLEKIRAQLAKPNGGQEELAERGLNLYDILASIPVLEDEGAEASFQRGTASSYDHDDPPHSPDSPQPQTPN